jgi:hypothetical protein
MSSIPSNNPLRKWEKKLRNAKTEEQKDKAESMLRVLRPKVKTVKETKPVLTEDQLLQEAIEENKKNRGLEEKKRVQEKVKALERERRRAEILSGKVKEDEKKVTKVEDEKEQYENYKKEQSDHNQRILSHMKHVEKFAEQERVKDKLIVQHKNKKKVDKEYKKFINKTCEIIELTIQFVKGSNEMSYEEALTIVYSKTVKEETPSNQEGSTQLSLTDKVEEPVQEDPVQEDPVQEDPVQEDPVQEEPVVEELTEEEWHNIVVEHPELKL